jgi:hypothetical protein
MAGRARQAAAIGLSALILTFGAASPARAETTRADYIAQAEPICQANTNANRHILKGAKARAKAGKLGAAGRQFTRAASAFGATVDQIAALPQPTDDSQILAQWIGYLRLESSYLGKVAVALKHRQGGKAEGFAIRLNRNANLANQVVTGYGFSSCLIRPNEFT